MVYIRFSPSQSLTLLFVRLGLSSLSILYVILHPIVLSIRLGREHSFICLLLLFHPHHALFYIIRSVIAVESVTYPMQFFGRPYICNMKAFHHRSVVFAPSHEVEPNGLCQEVLWISKNSSFRIGKKSAVSI